LRRTGTVRRLDEGLKKEEGLLGIVGVESGLSPSPRLVGKCRGEIEIPIDVTEQLPYMTAFQAFDGGPQGVADGESPE
jgi:hypothetical protein